jgi:hypothetical protein
MVEQKIEAINKVGIRSTPRFDGAGKLRGLTLNLDGVGTAPDISPVGALRDLEELRVYNLGTRDIAFLKGMKLKTLLIHGAIFSDLSPLEGMPLTDLELRGGPKRDCAVLGKLPLRRLDLEGNAVDDLSFLKGTRVEILNIVRTQVKDLSPLRALSLRELKCTFVPARDMPVVRSLTTLQKLQDVPLAEFFRSPDGGATVVQGPPTEVLTFNNHRYQWLPDRLTWPEAKAKAESLGGHLATIGTSGENTWILETFVKRLPQGLGLWIGGTNDGTPGKWRWVTGEQFGFNGWVIGEPNNRIEEPVILFLFRDQGDQGWVDLKDTGMGLRDRRGGLLVEWDDAGATAKGG